jgi:molybdopterin-biosynthesis enzyme MoeA-like protein
MSLLPDDPKAKLIFCQKDPNEWPVLQCANVFVLPGVPALFSAKLDVISRNILHGTNAPPLTRRIRLNVPEEQIIYELNAVVAAHPNITFGSYPVDQGDVQTVLTLETAADGMTELRDGLDSLLEVIPKTAVVDVSDCLSL